MNNNSPYMSQKEMSELTRLLTYKNTLKGTLSCWRATRINGESASMACEGNASPELLKAFDSVRDETIKNKGGE